MIKWGTHVVKIVGGNIKKREAIITPRRFTEKILVRWEDLRADDGIIEIVRAIKEAKGEK